jgi:hypothetical protein
VIVNSFQLIHLTPALHRYDIIEAAEAVDESGLAHQSYVPPPPTASGGMSTTAGAQSNTPSTQIFDANASHQ